MLGYLDNITHALRSKSMTTAQRLVVIYLSCCEGRPIPTSPRHHTVLFSEIASACGLTVEEAVEVVQSLNAAGFRKGVICTDERGGQYAGHQIVSGPYEL